MVTNRRAQKHVHFNWGLNLIVILDLEPRRESKLDSATDCDLGFWWPLFAPINRVPSPWDSPSPTPPAVALDLQHALDSPGGSGPSLCLIREVWGGVHAAGPGTALWVRTFSLKDCTM